MAFLNRKFFVITLICLVVLINISQSLAGCEVEDDLDFVDCNLQDLSTDALKAICDRVGLDIEQDIFTLLDEEMDNVSDLKERTHEDYIRAATECLEIDVYMEQMMDDPDHELDLENYADMYGDDQEVFEAILDVFQQNPDILIGLVDDLKREDPEFYADIQSELGDGETLSDRPDILAEVVALTLAENPDLMDGMEDGIEEFLGIQESGLQSDEM